MTEDDFASWGGYEGYLRFMVPRLGTQRVAKALHMGVEGVIQDCRRLGIAVRIDKRLTGNRGGKRELFVWTPEIDAELRRLRARGATYDECADAIGVSRAMVGYRIKTLKIKDSLAG